MLEQTCGWKMIHLWILLFLHAQLGGFTPLPPPSSVSISSFNMGHTLSFLPGPLSPAHARFMVQTIRLSRRKLWQSVVSCSNMADGQSCNLTKVFNDPFESYQARVRAFTSSQTSNWTLSGPFQPITDTVIGPPALSLSGCGNCLVLQITLPTFGGLQQQQQLRELCRKLDIQVRRSRDGAQFMMTVPITDQMVIPHLQTGVEYCVSVRVSSLFTTSSHYSQPICVYTSTPSPGHTAVFVLFGLMGALCSFGLLFVGVMICSGGRSFRNPHLLTALSILVLVGGLDGGRLLSFALS